MTKSSTLALATVRFWRFTVALANARHNGDMGLEDEMLDELRIIARRSRFPTLRAKAAEALAFVAEPTPQVRSEPTPLRRPVLATV